MKKEFLFVHQKKSNIFSRRNIELDRIDHILQEIWMPQNSRDLNNIIQNINYSVAILSFKHLNFNFRCNNHFNFQPFITIEFLEINKKQLNFIFNYKTNSTFPQSAFPYIACMKWVFNWTLTRSFSLTVTDVCSFRVRKKTFKRLMSNDLDLIL